MALVPDAPDGSSRLKLAHQPPILDWSAGWMPALAKAPRHVRLSSAEADAHHHRGQAMKIEHGGPLQRSETHGTRELRPQASQETATTTPTPGDSTQVELSSSSIDAGQDIDQARVDSLKQAIADGSIKIDVDRIAQGLIDAFEGDA
ncbi:flagellar biosynthesis anti-sigma factor FlgM [Cobetia marina]|nr:flagellar biosynthesis anti-sigma factor FlgM [Cobetia marina]